MTEDQGIGQPYIKGVVDRIEGDKVVIRLETGVEFLWPRERAKGLQETASVRLTIQTEADAKLNRMQLAKTILNEILKPTPENHA